MSSNRACRLILYILVGATVTGCETVVPPDRPVDARTFVGTIRIVSGTNVFLNGNPVRTGTSVLEGDRVSTGAGSSAIIEFPDRSFVQFDEHTDPYFGFLLEGACTLIRAFRIGQLFAQGRQICIQDDWGMVVVLESSINWRIADGRSTVTVVDGTGMLLPFRLPLRSGQQVTADKGVLTPGVVTLSEAQLGRVTLWRVKFPDLKVEPLPVPRPSVPIYPVPRPSPPDR